MLVSAARGWAYFGVDGHKLDQMHRVYVRAGEGQVCLLTQNGDSERILTLQIALFRIYRLQNRKQ